MKAVSTYSKRHRAHAWTIITFLHLCVLVISVYIGTEFDSLGIILSPAILLIAAMMFCTAIVLFKRHKKIYRLRLVAFSLVGIACFISTTFIFNGNRIVSYNVYSSGLSVKTESTSLSKKEKRLKIKQLKKYFLGELKKKSGYPFGKIVAMVSVILLALILLYIIACLACILTCNGAGLLASLVFGLGSVGVVMLALWALRKITGNKKWPEVNKTT